MLLKKLLPILLISLSLIGQDGEWNAQVTLEGLGFGQDSGSQANGNSSLAFEGEYYRDWDQGSQSLTAKIFLRWDEHDDERSHWDIRELTWLKAAEKWELRTGIRRVFWGVAESAHLVDIINQTDLVENLDGEEKLGQPMINFAWINHWGTLDFFALTGFRERTFPGQDGRFTTPFLLEQDSPIYESAAEDKRLDWAFRYSHSLGAWDIGVSHFQGTSREPLLQLALDFSNNPYFVPYYPVIDQSGLDLQATFGGWLWKMESIYRSGFGDEAYFAGVAGFEYTLGNLAGKGADLGLIGEYLYDERGTEATTSFSDDLFVGSRLALNDAMSTEILAGAVIDLSGGGLFYNLEAERRVGANMKLNLEIRSFAQTKPEEIIHNFHDDEHLRVSLDWYF